MVVTTSRQAALLVFLDRVGGQRNDWRAPAADLLFPDADRAGRGIAVHDRHLHVHQYQVEGFRLEAFYRFGTVLGFDHGIGLVAQIGLDEHAIIFIVLNQQDARAIAHRHDCRGGDSVGNRRWPGQGVQGRSKLCPLDGLDQIGRAVEILDLFDAGRDRRGTKQQDHRCAITVFAQATESGIDSGGAGRVDYDRVVGATSRTRFHHTLSHVDRYGADFACELPTAQHAGQDFRPCRLACDHQHSRPLPHWLWLTGAVRDRCQSRLEVKYAATAFGALHPDPATHHFDKTLTYRESKTGAAIATRDGIVDLGKTAKNAFEFPTRDTDTRIAYFEMQQTRFRRRCGTAYTHHYVTLLGELDGVTDKIKYYLTQTPRIAAHYRRHIQCEFGQQLDALGIGFQPVNIDGLLDDLDQVEFDILQTQLLGLDLREIENVVDLTQQRFASITKYADIFLLLAGQA